MKNRSTLILSDVAWLNKMLSTSERKNSTKGKPNFSGYISSRLPKPTIIKYRSKKPKEPINA